MLRDAWMTGQGKLRRGIGAAGDRQLWAGHVGLSRPHTDLIAAVERQPSWPLPTTKLAGSGRFFLFGYRLQPLS